MSSETYSYLYDKLFEVGALDVFSTPIFMKKNRPAYMLSIICNEKDKEQIEKVIFKETTTFGVRYTNMKRDILDRSFRKVDTSFGEVTVKDGYLNGELLKSTLEYEEMSLIAKKTDISLNNVIKECSKRI